MCVVAREREREREREGGKREFRGRAWEGSVVEKPSAAPPALLFGRRINK